MNQEKWLQAAREYVARHSESWSKDSLERQSRLRKKKEKKQKKGKREKIEKKEKKEEKKGGAWTQERRKRQSELLKGRKHTAEARERMAKARRGKRISEGTKIKISERHLGGHWYGSVRYDYRPKYCELFNNTFKERVRAFWGYICFECGEPEGGRKLTVHHIHYDKKMCCNGSPKDVIPLCTSCHVKTNGNRIFWEKYYTELLHSYCPSGKFFLTKDELASLINNNFFENRIINFDAVLL